MNPTPQNHTPKNFYPMSSSNSAAHWADQQINEETKHQVYKRLLTLLANPQIKVKETGAVLPYVLHSKTKVALLSQSGFSAETIAALEAKIIQNADENFREYEVVRDAPAALYQELARNDETDVILDNEIVPLPGAVLNAIICEELQKEFARKTLLACDGFIKVCGADENGIIHKSIRLDIEDWVTRRGFIMPIYRNGFITGLRIYRHPQDERPFRLRSRSKEGHQ